MRGALQYQRAMRDGAIRRCANSSLVRRAFTLIELLVSVAIIAALLAVAAPALSSARAEGMRARCLANMYALGQGMATYSVDDPRDYSTPVHFKAEVNWYWDGEYEYGGKTGLDLFAVPDFIAENRGLNRTLFGDPAGGQFDVFRCGGDQGIRPAPVNFEPYFLQPKYDALSTFDVVGTSYRLNNHIDFLSKTPYFKYFYGPYLRPRTRIPQPSEVVLLEETAAEVAKWNDPSVASPGWHRRSNMYNVAFADGHVGTIRLAGQNDTSPPDYWILRGDGWRMDCYPQQPVLDRPRPPGT